jgi:2-keto-4-pentenoate hydratase/2-oxohepta-3-ene-1,7-dioic acid hydratase in catechol pathway
MHLVTFERAHLPRAEHDSGALGDAAMGFESIEPVRPGSHRLGAVLSTGDHAGWLVDLNRALSIKLAYDDVGAPEVEANSLVPSDMLSLLRLGPTALDAARTAIDFATDALSRYNAPDFMRAGAVEPADHVRICAPLPRPGKIVAALGGEIDRRDAGTDDAAVPSLFLKAPSAVIGPSQEIHITPSGSRVSCRAGIAAVIGDQIKNVTVDRALDSVVGYCAANDVSSPDLEDASVGRSCDTFAPLGPWLVTADEVSDPADLSVRMLVSGDVVQSTRTKEARFSIAQVVAHASAAMTLEAGDIVIVGMSNGAELPESGERWLRDGDVVEVEIGSLGRLHNYVTSAKPA